MSQFTITKVLGSREWKPPEGDKTFVFYDILFEGDQGKADDLSKPASWKTLKGEPAPTDGQTVDAEMVHKDGKVKLEPVRKGGWGGRGGGGGKTPQERAEIRRMAAQKAAVETFRAYVELAISVGKAEEFKGKQPREILDPLIAYFDEDVRKAGEAS
jgi:hypothetical protein